MGCLQQEGNSRTGVLVQLKGLNRIDQTAENRCHQGFIVWDGSLFLFLPLTDRIDKQEPLETFAKWSLYVFVPSAEFGHDVFLQSLKSSRMQRRNNNMFRAR
jgi:hypothetical protein